MELELDVSRAADVSTVSVAGEVDIDSAPRLAAVLTEVAAESTTVVIDCRRLGFMDSTGLSVLLAAHRDLEERGGRLELRDPPQMLAKMLKIVGLDDVLHVTTS